VIVSSVMPGSCAVTSRSRRRRVGLVIAHGEVPASDRVDKVKSKRAYRETKRRTQDIRSRWWCESVLSVTNSKQQCPDLLIARCFDRRQRCWVGVGRIDLVRLSSPSVAAVASGASAPSGTLPGPPPDTVKTKRRMFCHCAVGG
jgi:hypothetical protein